MKKLAVLALILAVASLANAATLNFGAGSGVTWDGSKYVVDIGSTFTIQVTADVGCSSFVLNVKSDNLTTTAGLVNEAFTTANLDGTQWNGTTNSYVTTPGLMIWKAAGTRTGTVDAGTILYSFTAQAGNTANVVWTFDSMAASSPLTGGPSQATKLNTVTTVVPTFAVTVIPEPVTIALLGLGGLFLRRRMA